MIIRTRNEPVALIPWGSLISEMKICPVWPEWFCRLSPKKAFSLRDGNARLTLNVGDKSLLFQGDTIPKCHLGVKEKETTR